MLTRLKKLISDHFAFEIGLSIGAILTAILYFFNIFHQPLLDKKENTERCIEYLKIRGEKGKLSADLPELLNPYLEKEYGKLSPQIKDDLKQMMDSDECFDYCVEMLLRELEYYGHSGS